MVSDACGDLALVPPGFQLMEEERSGDVGVMQPSTDSMVKFSVLTPRTLRTDQMQKCVFNIISPCMHNQ